MLTDHKPLTYALNTRSDRHSPRQARQLDYISQFTSTIRHIHGSDNVVADTLSRIETNVLISGTPPVVDYAAMAKSQATEPQIRALQFSPSSPLVVEPIPLPNAGDPLYCDISTSTQRPPGPPGMATHCVQFSTQPLTLRNPSDTEAHHCPVCMAWC